jgi:dolichyl-phosphate-mannose--protein O-mannosyl transferase
MVPPHGVTFEISRMIFMGWRLGAWVSVVLIVWLRVKAIVCSIERRKRLAALRALRRRALTSGS